MMPHISPLYEVNNSILLALDSPFNSDSFSRLLLDTPLELVELSPPGYHGPLCTLTPVRECTPRTVEDKRKVCQTVLDVYEDTVVEEQCEETVTTVCTQKSESKTTTINVVNRSTEKVKTGEPLPADSIATSHQHYGKREASALGLSSHGYVSHPVRKVEPADCKSEPVKDCKEVPTTVKRSVPRVVCETVVEEHQVQDCTETVTRKCTSTEEKSEDDI